MLVWVGSLVGALSHKAVTVQMDGSWYIQVFLQRLINA